MQQNDLSDFISQIANKYEKPNFNTNNEDHIISQAEDLLHQFGFNSKNTVKKKKSKKVDIESKTKFAKKQFKPINNQISALIIAPRQNSPIIDKKEDNDLFLSSNCELIDDISDILDQIGNDEINDTKQQNTEISNKHNKSQVATKKRTKLNEIDLNTLNNLLNEIEADFSSQEKQKNENKRKYKKENSNIKTKTEITKKDENTTKIIKSDKLKKNNKVEDNTQTKSEKEDEFSNEIDKINFIFLKKYFSKMKNKFIIRDKYYKLVKLNHKIFLKIFFHRWIEAKKNQQNIPRFKEFDHLKRIEELGDEYQKQIFTRKFLLIWARQYRLKVQTRINKEIERQNINPDLKPLLKKPKLIKKPPPPPPIQVDPKIDQMIKQNKEIKDQKLNNVKIQIKQDKMKQQQIQKEQIESEKKKRMKHLKNLQKQKIERQNKIKNEEEKIRNQKNYSLLCNKAEDYYLDNLKNRVFKSWKSILIYREKMIDATDYRFKLFLMRKFFNQLKEKFNKIDNKKMILANQFNNRLIMKRSLIALKKVKEERNKKFPIIQKNCELHSMRHFFNEWKNNQISSRRKKKLKSIEFYESHLLKKYFKAYLAAIKQNKEEEKRQNFKEKLIQKAHQYLNENQQINSADLHLTLNSENQQSDQMNNNIDDVYEPIEPLKDTLHIPLNLFDSNDDLKFDNSDDLF